MKRKASTPEDKSFPLTPFETPMRLLRDFPFLGPAVAYPIVSITIGTSLWTLLQVFDVASVVEMSPNIRLPRWLLVIFGSLFLGALVLIALLVVVNLRRSRNETLTKLDTHIKNIEDRQTALRLFLLNQALDSTLHSVRLIGHQAEEEDTQKGVGNYRAKVIRRLAVADKDTTILALCGEKGLSDLESKDYFEDFFRYAKNNQEYLKGVGGIRVCRIFVESSGGGFHKTTTAVIEAHRAHEAYGVIALELPEESHKDLKEYSEIIKTLDTGAGYVLFLKHRDVYSITHEGVKENLKHMEFNDSVTFHALLRLFRALCIRSNEYKANEKTRKELDSFFDRVQIPID